MQLFEEEAYSLFPKCRPLRRPRHLRGLGLGLGFIVDSLILDGVPYDISK